MYETDGDLRRVDHLRRKNAVLTEKCNGLEQLLTCLQLCNEHEAAALLQRVRSGENISDTVNLAMNGLCQSPTTNQRKLYTPPPTPSVAGSQCQATEIPGSSSYKYDSPAARFPGSVYVEAQPSYLVEADVRSRYKKTPRAHQRPWSRSGAYGSDPTSTTKDSSSVRSIKTPEPDIKVSLFVQSSSARSVVV